MITVSENVKKSCFDLIAKENHPEGTFIRVGIDGGGGPACLTS